MSYSQMTQSLQYESQGVTSHQPPRVEPSVDLESCAICHRHILCRWLVSEFKVLSLCTHDGTWLTPGTQGLKVHCTGRGIPFRGDVTVVGVIWSLPVHTDQTSYRLRMSLSP